MRLAVSGIKLNQNYSRSILSIYIVCIGKWNSSKEICWTQVELRQSSGTKGFRWS